MDSVTAEVRRIRKMISARFDHDPEKYGKHLSELEEKLRKSGRFKFADVEQHSALREEPSNE